MHNYLTLSLFLGTVFAKFYGPRSKPVNCKIRPYTKMNFQRNRLTKTHSVFIVLKNNGLLDVMQISTSTAIIPQTLQNN